MTKTFDLSAAKRFSNALNSMLDKINSPRMNHGRIEALMEITKRPKSTVHRWLNGQGIPDAEGLIALSNVFSCTIDDLLGRRNQTNHLQLQGMTVTYMDGVVSVPFQVPIQLLSNTNRVGPYGITRITGSEMEGYLNHNDCVIFDLGQTKVLSGHAYVLCANKKMIVRRLKILLTGEIEVVCQNPLFGVERILPSQLLQRSSPCENCEDCSQISILGLVLARYQVKV